MFFFFFWLLYSFFLFIVSPSNGCKILLRFQTKTIFRALHRVQPSWTNSGDCPRSREERRVFGLIAYQARVCVRLPELIPHIINAASLTVDVCQAAFANRRWNCSSILTAPNLSAELNSGW